MLCNSAGLLLILIILPVNNVQGCKSSEPAFSTHRAFFKPGTGEQINAEIATTPEGGVSVRVNVQPEDILENGGREWDGEEWKPCWKDVYLEVREEGETCFRAASDPPEYLGDGIFSWSLPLRPCGEVWLRLRVTGQFLELEDQILKEYENNLGRMEDLSLCQFRTQYLRTFPQVLDYPGSLKTPSAALIAPVVRATITDQLTAHYWKEDFWEDHDSICHGPGCAQSNTSTVVVNSVSVDWRPVGCAHGYLYNQTSSTGGQYRTIRVNKSLDRYREDLCVSLPKKNLLEFYTEEYIEEPRCSVAPSQQVCGVMKVSVTPWRTDGGERVLGPAGELEVDTGGLQVGEEVSRREVTFVEGVWSLYSGGERGEEGDEQCGMGTDCDNTNIFQKN
eukprot:GFUD01034039.1.p1 GENE.GFUD01034039.1~~GFUD01034039.1.p1  ORF type:complete len:406 (+),score=100.70 GFUD01034039.1:48-1220(+)